MNRLLRLSSKRFSSSFLSPSSTPYIEQMYAAWMKNPTSVHVSWASYFSNIQAGSKQPYTPPPNFIPTADAKALQSLGSTDEILDHLKVQLLVRAYQVRGHNLASLDPLGITKFGREQDAPELDHKYYGFSERDLDKEFKLGPGILQSFGETMTLKKIISSLKDIYCESIGVEYTHCSDRTQSNWIRSRVEVPNRIVFSGEEKRRVFDRLVWSSLFENFVASKWRSEKRFGLEGCEALIPGMKALIDRSVEHGVESIVMGMPHRGRLNVLSNVVRKPNESIFCEFSGTEPAEEGSGDVKYHLGMSYERPTPSGKRVHLSLVANPSHLEAVDPVVLGKVKALQFYKKDIEKAMAMGILLHGDAAFSAQGVVYESLGFADLPGYSTGGTIHIICNNQVGFTTDPRFARSTPYCTDVAKSIQAPILHVNGDDVEAVVFACNLAADWRREFKKDIVIDIVCYRRYGHNEIDQPSFTQPLMYSKISKQLPVLEKYAEQLQKEGTCTNEYIEENKRKVWDILEASYQSSKDYKPTSKEWQSSSWEGFKSPKELAMYATPVYPTGAPMDVLKSVGKAISTYPDDFSVHSNLKKILKARETSIEEGKGIDWPTAEGLAFGSLMLDGKHVRLSGQDVERGTFSQRHAVLHDQKTEKQLVPLANLAINQAPFTVCNSSLSEFGCLGFDLGYSLVNPNSLTLWEAQFGDFGNNAQCIIDQFIASGESKWLQRTGLTLLLPHGFDGQGPEHSSGRIERFLQLCDEQIYGYPEDLSRQHQDCNMQIAYCSTPAQYFHILRRQIYRDFRKPLILFTSKSLLRHPQCKSDIEDMAGNTRFQRFIPDPLVKEATKVILSSGQVYYTLLKTREANNLKDVALARVEQMSPFPYEQVKDYMERFPNAQVTWVQEEPMNMGAWSYVQPRIDACFEKLGLSQKVKVVAREPTGAVATGNKKQHVREEIKMMAEAYGFEGESKDVVNGAPVW